MSSISFCCASGQRMRKDEATACPHCRYPANRGALEAHLERFQACPMCGRATQIADLASGRDVSALAGGV